VFAQDSVSVAASADNTLYEIPDGSISNGAGEHLFIGRTNQASNSVRRAVLKFDLTGKIPNGAQVTSTSLAVHVSKVSNADPQGADLFSLTSDWGEGTSNADANEGSGAAAASGDATWLHRSFNTTLWTTQGGDFAAESRSHILISGNGAYVFNSTVAMVSDAQGWIDSPSTNFGWIVIGNESAGQSSKRIDSREIATTAFRPQLTVHYQLSTGVKKENGIPQSFALSQNYPNPFNPSTSISYHIPQSGSVTLRVFDMLGNSVATVVDEIQPAGSHTVRFNGEGLSSGLYFYRLQSGSFTAVQKMTLLK